ncbi:MAG: sulfotransferase domain-containing protein [Burkholderiales bacterium]|nr:sulfotransferase domain-containing protein [Burkholderiales bacterium]
MDPREDILKQWLPVLSERDCFKFEDGVEVQWSHEWPTEELWRCRVVYFVRDPRDALYSRYRREGASVPFYEYLLFPDAFTLLDKIDHWRAFNECWLPHPNRKLIRFEDSKAAPVAVLKEAIEWLGLVRSDKELIKAVDASSFDRAAQAERRYLAKCGGKQVINRAGRVGEWRELAAEREAMEKITGRCAPVLRVLGYEAPNEGVSLLCSSKFKRLRYFKTIRLTRQLREAAAGDDESLRLLISKLEPALLKAVGLSESETHVLLDTLSEYACSVGWTQSVVTLERLYELLGIRRTSRWAIQKARLRAAVNQLFRIGDTKL